MEEPRYEGTDSSDEIHREIHCAEFAKIMKFADRKLHTCMYAQPIEPHCHLITAKYATERATMMAGINLDPSAVSINHNIPTCAKIILQFRQTDSLTDFI